MEVTRITAFADRIEIDLSKYMDENMLIEAREPLIDGTNEGEIGKILLSQNAAGNPIILPRFAETCDLLTARFSVFLRGERLAGARYVTDFGEDFCPSSPPEPHISRPLGTWLNADMEDVEYMRFGCMMDELDQVWLMTDAPKEDDIPHAWNGKTYWFDRRIVAEHDKYHIALGKRGIPVLMRFINRDKYHNRASSGGLFDRIRHPGYETDFDGVEMSAVNLRTVEGLEHYCACLDFLFSRYASADSPYGLSYIMDVGNEVNSQRIWHNACPMPCAAFMEEYAVALRLAWLIARKYNRFYRVNISLEQNFNRPFRPDPLRYYGARECLEYLADIGRRDGDFDWGVAAHPYPENLSYPDFYNDRAPTFSFDTPLITMKNMEVWPAFLSQEKYRYRGQTRHVVFDEQGFNTRDDAPYTEAQGAYAFVLAYLKLRKNALIDLFLIHRYVDIPFNQEYGLNLGLRRCLGYADEEHLVTIPGPRKMICEAIAAMDGPDEGKWVRDARAYIGDELFDAILNPPPIVPDGKDALTTNFDM